MLREDVIIHTSRNIRVSDPVRAGQHCMLWYGYAFYLDICCELNCGRDMNKCNPIVRRKYQMVEWCIFNPDPEVMISMGLSTVPISSTLGSQRGTESRAPVLGGCANCYVTVIVGLKLVGPDQVVL